MLQSSRDRVVGRVSMPQFLTEPEDDQERVVDRDAEPHERDQELHDDRHVVICVRRNTSVNVLRIDATAVSSGIAIAGSVPNTKSRRSARPGRRSTSREDRRPLLSPCWRH